LSSYTLTDPVGTGVVDSLARPGRNATGTSLTPQILWGKRFELIPELIGHQPWVGDPKNVMAERNLAAVMEAAEHMGVKLDHFEAREPADLDRIFAAAAGSDAELVQWDVVTGARAFQQVAELAVRYQLPTIYDNRLYIVNGGLISYSANYRDNWRRGASYVDRILRGARPKDLPVEQPTKFELVINLKAAKAIGLAVPPAKALDLTVPPELLATADEVIEMRDFAMLGARLHPTRPSTSTTTSPAT
jgi:putative tryptophan/tyrosine transport system substrate-binding protein